MASSRGLPLFILVFAALSGSSTRAQSLSSNFTVEGRLYDSTGAPYNAPVDITFEVLNGSASNCVLYSETWSSVDVSSTDATAQGVFSLRLGQGPVKNYAASFGTVFANSSKLSGLVEDAAGGTSYGAGCNTTPAAGDERVVRIKVKPAGGATYDVLSPDTRVTSVPTAMIADSLQGYTPSSFILTNTNTSLQQSNLDQVFTTPNFTTLMSMLSGNLAPSGSPNFNGQTLTNLGAPSAASDATTKSYVDSTLGGMALSTAGLSNGMTLSWNSASAKWEATSAAAGVTQVAAGNGLSGGPITSSGTLSVDVGTTANKILQLDASARIQPVDGSQVFNVNASKLRGNAVASASPAGGQVLTWNSLNSDWEPANSGGISALTGDVSATGPGSAAATIQPNAVTSAKINNTGVAINRLLITNGVDGSTVKYADSCSINQVLQWTAIGWQCADVSVMLGNVNASTPATYGNSGQVAQVAVDSQGRITQISNVNIAFPVTTVAGRTGAVSLALSDLSGVGHAAYLDLGTGLIEPTAGTMAVDVGVAANQILQLDSSAKIPAVDGSQLMNVNAVKLQGRAVGTASPIGGQVLAYNSLAGEWDPASMAVASGGAGAIQYSNGGGGLASNGNVVIDGVNSRIGIGTATPSMDLDVNGNIRGNSYYLSGSQMVTSTGYAAFPGTVTARSTTVGTLDIGVASGAARAIGVEPTAIGAGSNLTLTAGAANSGTDLNGGNLVISSGAATGAGKSSIQFQTAGGLGSGSSTTAAMTRMTITGGGNVGIGVPNALHALEVSSTQNIVYSPTGATTGPLASLFNGAPAVKISSPGSSDNAGTYLEFSQKNANGNAQNAYIAAISSTGASSYAPAMVFGQQTGSAAYSERMRIDTSGNVGIGTIAPNALLDVAGTMRVQMICDSTGANCKSVSGGWGSGGSVTNIVAGTGMIAGTITTAGTLNVDVGTNANQVLGLNASAQIPAVDGSLLTNVKAANILGKGLASVSPAASQVLTYNNILGQWDAETPAAVVHSTGNSGALQASDGSGGFLSNNNIVVDSANGRVGIGTTTPGYPLDVKGAINLNNDLRIQGSTALAQDFVKGNLAVGGGAMNIASATGNSNTSIGFSALAGAVGSSNNTAVGTSALQSTSGGNNTAIGMNALSNGGAGAYNVAVGVNAMFSANGNYNIAIGPDAMKNASSSPTNNVVIGNGAGVSLLSGSENILIGDNADVQTSGASNSLNIGNLVYGIGTSNFGGGTSGEIGINSANPQAALDVVGFGSNSAIIVPRDTSGSRPSTPVNGMIRYATDTNQFEAYQNNTWMPMVGAASLNNTGVASGAYGSSTMIPLFNVDSQGRLISASAVTVDVPGALGYTPVNRLGDSILINPGSAAAPSLAFTSYPNTGLYNNGANIIGVAANGSNVVNFTPSGIASTVANSANINTASVGNAANPTYGFLGGGGTGLYSSAANTISVATNGQQRLYIDSSGHLGVNNPSPNASFDLMGNMNVMYTLTPSTSGSFYANYFNTSYQPTASPASAQVYGSDFYIADGGTQSLTGVDLYGVSTQATHTTNSGLNSLTGFSGTAYASGTGTVNSAYGASHTVNGPGNINVAYGSYNMIGTAGTVLNAYGSYNSVAATGPITNNAIGSFAMVTSTTSSRSYGMYVSTVNGPANNKWSFYAADMTAPSYFAGNVGVGTTTPQSALDVNGTGQNSAIIVPRDTQANRPVAAVDGMVRYNTTTQSLEARTAGNWGSVPGIVASNDLISATTNQANLISVTPPTATLYRVTCLVVAQAASAGTMPACTITYTDADSSTAQTNIIVSASASTPSAGTQRSGTAIINVAAGTTLTANTQGAAGITYAVHIRVEKIQ